MFYSGRGKQLIKGYPLLLTANEYLVEGSPDINGAVLDDSINNLRDGSCKVRVGEFRMEEDLGAKETLITNIDLERLWGRGGNVKSTMYDSSMIKGNHTLFRGKPYNSSKEIVIKGGIPVYRGLHF